MKTFILTVVIAVIVFTVIGVAVVVFSPKEEGLEIVVKHSDLVRGTSDIFGDENVPTITVVLDADGKTYRFEGIWKFDTTGIYIIKCTRINTSSDAAPLFRIIGEPGHIDSPI